MTDLEIVAVDPLNQELVEQVLAVWQTVQDTDAPFLPRIALAPYLVGLVRRVTSFRTERWVARRGGMVVAAADIRLPLQDNLHLAEIELGVAPDQRCRGVGNVFLRHVEQRVVANDRDTIVTSVADPIESRPSRPSGQRFAESAGYIQVLDEIHLVADVAAVGDPELDVLLAHAWQEAGEYELVQWTGGQPDEVVDGVAYLSSRMILDAPFGELSLEQQDIDAARVREDEANSYASGMLLLGTAVRHRASGEIAGYTDIHVIPGDEKHCWQGATIVDPRHRGHKLGTILKIQNYRLLRSYRPRIRYVHTWNAAGNTHMIAINEAIGYRAVDRRITYQKELFATD